jgi:hypothetical protein
MKILMRAIMLLASLSSAAQAQTQVLSCPPGYALNAQSQCQHLGIGINRPGVAPTPPLIAPTKTIVKGQATTPLPLQQTVRCQRHYVYNTAIRHCEPAPW